MTTLNNWDDGEKLLYHTFYNELRVAPEESPVTLTVPPRASRSYLEKMTQIMFETFSVPCLNFVHQATACVVAHGVYSGLVVLMGHQNVHVVPVHQLRALEDAAVKIPIGGLHITRHIAQELGLTTTAELEIAQDIKIKHGFVSLDYEADSREASRHEVNYEMPDGTVTNLSNVRFIGPEAYFKPSLLGKSSTTLPEAIATAISNCDYSLRKKMASNIFLAGGSSLFPNMAQRIERELKNEHSLIDLDIRVKGTNERHSVWVGCSIYASLSTYPYSTMVTKEDYDTMGPSLVHLFYNYPLSE
eukprot:TRINITY_DN5087_c0_g1_i1.p1 TRINITY_DN5087_c0_g1~~TRINITY_DN5087_c0_g1_i1.p1  ORF type:complete len:302 (+),score=25.58 TRINITY_DN5087_c0_g1_i1:101-1006(+)